MSKSIKEIYETLYGSMADPFFTTIVKTLKTPNTQSMGASVWTGSVSLDPSIIKNNSLFNIIFKKPQPKIPDIYSYSSIATAPAGYSSGSYSYFSPQSGSYVIGVDPAI